MNPTVYPLDRVIPLPEIGSWPATVHLFEEESTYALAAAEESVKIWGTR